MPRGTPRPGNERNLAAAQLLCGRSPPRSPAYPSLQPRAALVFGERFEIVGRHACGANEAAERPLREFLVVGNGKGRQMTILHEDHMTAPLAVDRPAGLLKTLTASAPLKTESRAIRL